MTNKTIPALDLISAITDNALFIVDSGTQTFKMLAGDLVTYFRESILPAGITAPYAGTAVPNGWLYADGSAVSRTTFARLFAAIGVTYGTGNGTTTFNVPDLRGRVVAGKDDMGNTAAGRLTNAISGIAGTTLGAAGGTEPYTPIGVLGGNQSIAHTHNISHVHQSLFMNTLLNAKGLFTIDPSIINLTTSNTKFLFSQSAYSTLGPGSGTTLVTPGPDAVGGSPAYTSGVLNSAAGSGSSAVSGAMSTGDTVNGVSFSFTGTAAHRVQPTIILNQLIKT